jgi:hypothetical protein
MLVVMSAVAMAANSAARIQVTPAETEVYVDGIKAGLAADFDGFTQRLRVAPGEHVVELYLDGHKAVRQTIWFGAGQTYRIRHTMEKLAPGEASPPRPVSATPAAGAAPAAFDAFGRSLTSTSPATATAAGHGVIAIRVQPADAVILIDGERWQGSAGDRLEVQVTGGSHRLEVRKDGYQPFSSVVEVRPGETAAVNVSLTRAGGVQS